MDAVPERPLSETRTAPFGFRATRFVKHSRSEPALSTYDECPVSRQAQPGKIVGSSSCAAMPRNFGLAP